MTTQTPTIRRRLHERADATAAEGRAARAHAPRRRSGQWDPSLREASALSRLQAQEAVRDETLLPLRYARMASSPWAYLRGAAAVMAADLATAPHSGLTVQMCGDAHILNFGLWASPERHLLFDARDFDETLPGPFEWDVKRLATSIYVIAAAENLPMSVADEAVENMVSSYSTRMKRYARSGELDVWYDQISAEMNLEQLDSSAAEKVGQLIRRGVKKRSRAAAIHKLTEVVDGKLRITEDPPFRRHFEMTPERAAVVQEKVFDTYIESVPHYLSRLVSRYSMTDVVRQVVGVGSVGMRVYLYLMEGDSGREPIFFQVKQATASVYEPYVGASAYDNHGERVATGQRLMQTASDVFLGHMRVDDRDFYVRQFRDMKIIPSGPEIAGILPQFAGLCGAALSKSHARSGDPAAINAYIGSGTAFVTAMKAYGRSYAQQTADDHADLVSAIAAGSVAAADSGW